MKTRTKEKILLGVIIIFLASSCITFISLNNTSSKKNVVLQDKILKPINDPNKLKSSATYTSNLTIDNADGTKNWVWAATQAWCSGSGTPGDPYLINEYTIQFNNSLNGEYACINISNSHDVYFKISNCNVRNNASDYGIGISLSNCTNGIINTVTASNNGDDGIYIINSWNITITDSIMNSNHHYGLNMDNCSLFTMTTDTMNLNTLGGAYLLNSTYCIFQISCNFTLNTNGLILSDSDLNNVTAGIFNNNTNYGIEILNSDQNHIFNSNIENNTAIGLLIYEEGHDSRENVIKGNTFTSNTINAMCNSSSNHFNSTTTGNSWSDYSGVDADDDGIGDTPYDISGSANAKDFIVTYDDGDSIAPRITIILPTLKSIYFYPPKFSISIVEAVGISTRWYTLDGGTTNITFTGTSGTIDDTEWDSITGLAGQTREVSIVFYVNDTAGNLGTKSIIVNKYFEVSPSHEKETEEKVAKYFVEQVYVSVTLIAIFVLHRIVFHFRKLENFK